jgi:hypothetical protein
MPNYEPYVANLDLRRAPLYLSEVAGWPGLPDNLAARRAARDLKGHTGLWVNAPGRKRDYVCSRGVTHLRYWRRWQKGGGYPIDMRCEEHEITFT